MKKIICLVLVFTIFPIFQISNVSASDQFDYLISKWVNHLCGASSNGTNTGLTTYLTTTASTAKSQQQSMITNPTTILWSDSPFGTSSASISNSFVKIKQMALGYATPGAVSGSYTAYKNSTLLNTITTALDFMYANIYNENINASTGWYDNWWHWEIDAPDKITDILSILGNDLNATTKTNMLKAVDYFCPAPDRANLEPSYTYMFQGANRAWRSKIVILSGALQKNINKTTDGVTKLAPTYNYVTEGEGFYKDGTFIAHTAFSYAGGYGKTLLEYLGYIFNMISGSQFDISTSDKMTLYDIINKTFIPGLESGEFMDMFRGREIARYNYNSHAAANTTLRAMLMIGITAPEPYKSKFLGIVKEQNKLDITNGIYNNAAIDERIALNSVLNDTTIANVPQTPFHQSFPKGDRVVHRQSNYTFGLAMFSSRILNFEGKDIDENRKGWYTGAGTTYLYNGVDQYTDLYPTIDSKRFPGTTVSQRDPLPSVMFANSSISNNATFVGGADLGLNGIAGMQYTDVQLPIAQSGTHLTANKSWFMFDDEIVCLGSDINSNDTAYPINTIVENRKVTGSNNFFVNGTLQSSNVNTVIPSARYASIQGVAGYYFPEAPAMNVKREVRTGKWSDINVIYPQSTAKTGEYSTMWFNHGSAPSAGSYQYVILPGMTDMQTEQYATTPDISVLKNDNVAHAVRKLSQNILAVNFWTDTIRTVGDLTVDKKCSVIVSEDSNTITIALSDPTQLNTGLVNLSLARTVANVASADSGITITNVGSDIKLAFNVNNRSGNTMTIKLNKTQNIDINSNDATVDFPEYTLGGSVVETSDVEIYHDSTLISTLLGTTEDFNFQFDLHLGINALRVESYSNGYKTGSVIKNVTLKLPTVQSENIIIDNSFERNLSENWKNYNGSLSAYTSIDKFDGNKSFIFDTGSANYKTNCEYKNAIKVNRNTNMTLTWYSKFINTYTTSSTNIAQIGISPDSLYSSFIVLVPLNDGATNEWRNYCVTFNTGQNDYIYIRMSAQSIKSYVDDIHLYSHPSLQTVSKIYDTSGVTNLINSGSTLSVHSYYYNTITSDLNVTPLIALYKNNVLVNVQTASYTVLANNRIKKITLIQVPDEPAIYTIKLFNWGSMGSIRPYQ